MVRGSPNSRDRINSPVGCNSHYPYFSPPLTRTELTHMHLYIVNFKAQMAYLLHGEEHLDVQSMIKDFVFRTPLISSEPLNDFIAHLESLGFVMVDSVTRVRL